MPCMSCGSDERDYCEGCFSEALSLLQEATEYPLGSLAERVHQFLERIEDTQLAHEEEG